MADLSQPPMEAAHDCNDSRTNLALRVSGWGSRGEGPRLNAGNQAVVHLTSHDRSWVLSSSIGQGWRYIQRGLVPATKLATNEVIPYAKLQAFAATRPAADPNPTHSDLKREEPNNRSRTLSSLTRPPTTQHRISVACSSMEPQS